MPRPQDTWVPHSSPVLGHSELSFDSSLVIAVNCRLGGLQLLLDSIKLMGFAATAGQAA